MKMKKKLFGLDTKAIICLLLIFAASFVLFYRYIFQLQTSDFIAHIERSLAGRGYSINLILFPLFYKLGNSYLPIVFLMSALIVLTVISTAWFLKKIAQLIGEDYDLSSLILFSASLLFICKLCIPEWSPYFYKTSLSTQPWHNSTYIEMRLFGTLTLMMYFIIRKDYLKKIEWKKLLLFFVFLFLTNMSKPNFVLCFAPIMLVVLIYDFISSKGKSFKNAFCFGFVVLIACIILLFQYKAMYPGDGSSSIVISLEHAIAYVFSDKKFPLYYLLNFCFPLYVTFLFFKNRKKMSVFENKMMLEIWMMNLFSLLVSMFVTETGKRANDGNYEWANAYFAYILFGAAMIVLKKMKKDGLISEREYVSAQNIYVLHVVLGIFYFLLLVMGYLSWVI